MNVTNLSGSLLVAVPGLEDPNFSRTVTLICEHSKDGAFGIVINRVLMNSFTPLLSSFDIRESMVDMPVHYGGPVKPDQGYVIYSPFDDRYVSIKVSLNLAVTASKEILTDIASGMGPDKYLFALGFAGWGANQLEDELIADSWLVAPFDHDLVFKVPVAERWRYAVESIGVDLERYIHRGGHA